MPIGNDPPDGILASTIFNDINDLSYSANDKAFKDDTTGDLYYLYLDMASSSTYKGRWALDKTTAKSTHPNPWGKIPQATADILLNGTYVNANKVVDYQNKSYRFRLEWDNSASEIVVAAREY